MQSKLQRTKSPPGTTRSVPFPFCTGASPAFQPVCGHVLSCQPPPWSTVYSSTPCKTQQLVSHDHTPQPIGRSNQLPTPPPPPGLPSKNPQRHTTRILAIGRLWKLRRRRRRRGHCSAALWWCTLPANSETHQCTTTTAVLVRVLKYRK
jgi:hypothetical protein